MRKDCCADGGQLVTHTPRDWSAYLEGLKARVDAALAMNRQDEMVSIPISLVLELRAAALVSLLQTEDR